MITSKLPLLVRSGRQLMMQSVRRSGHGHEEVVYKGQNLPFDITNHRMLAIKMTIFFGIPFAAPFIIVRYQLKKAAGHYSG